MRWVLALGIVGSTCTPAVGPVARGVLPPVVAESSGLVASARLPGVFWTHNDSGDVPRLFAVDGAGGLLGEIAVDGAEAVDWEAITRDDAGNLWIADLGNNRSSRTDLTLYRVPEPAPEAGRVAADRVVRVAYPEQTAFPDPGLAFDCEAVWWEAGTLWLATKHRKDTRTVLYRVDGLEGAGSLTRVAELDVGGADHPFGGQVTDADLHPSGRWLALLTYHAVLVLERAPGEEGFGRVVHTVELDGDVTGQCEAVAWDGWSLVFTNEGRGVFRIDDPFRADSFPPATEAP
ncbi:MAG: hypothetical protein H6732_19390 [Alphaproteobacteria bacterium]|nr:hypothetical protein [Alphaproteobacteria bacterium]